MEPQHLSLKEFFANRIQLWNTVIKTLARGYWQGVAEKLSSKGISISPSSIEAIEDAFLGDRVAQAQRFMEDIREHNITLTIFREALHETGLEELALEIRDIQEELEFAKVAQSTVFVSFDINDESSFINKFREEFPHEAITILSKTSSGAFTIIALGLSSKSALQFRKRIEENRYVASGVVHAVCCVGTVPQPTKEVLERLCAGGCSNLFGSPITGPKTFLFRNELRKIIMLLLESKVCAIQGLGGLGKTTLANEVVRDPRVCRFFAKIYWATLGSEPNGDRDRIAMIIAILVALDESLESKCRTATLEQARTFLQAQTCRLFSGQKKLLIVLDNVWSGRDVELLRGVTNTYILITTQIEEISTAFSATLFSLPYLDKGQAVKLLLDVSRVKEEVEPETRAKVVRKCGGLPLAIQVIGSLACRKPPLETPWTYVSQLQANWKAGNHLPKDSNYQYSIFSALGISASQLGPEVVNYWQQLVIFPEDVWIPESVLGLLWGLDDFESHQQLDCLSTRALLEKNVELHATFATYRLHDVVRSYLHWKIATTGICITSMHLRLVNNYKARLSTPADWTTGPLDSGGYLIRQLAYHYQESKLPDTVIFYIPLIRGQAAPVEQYEAQLSWRIAAVRTLKDLKWTYHSELFSIFESLLEQDVDEENLAITFIRLIFKFNYTIEKAKETYCFGDTMRYGIFGEAQCFSVWGAADRGYRQLTQLLLANGARVFCEGRDQSFMWNIGTQNPIVKEILLPRLFKEPPATIAAVLLEDPSGASLQTLMNLGYNRWPEVFECITPSAITAILQKATFKSSAFLRALHALNYNFNVTFEPLFVAGQLLTGSEYVFDLLKSIGYNRWQEVFASIAPQQVIGLIQSGDFIRLKPFVELHYPRWELVHSAFKAAELVTQIETATDERRINFHRKGCQDIMNALKMSGYPLWPQVFSLMEPLHVAQWIREKENPLLPIKCLLEIEYPLFPAVCELFVANELYTFIKEAQWLKLECFKAMSYGKWQVVFDLLRIEDIKNLVTKSSYLAAQTVCLLGSLGLRSWNNLDPAFIASLFSMELATQSSSMLLSLRKFGFTCWPEVFVLLDAFEFAYQLVLLDDAVASNKPSHGHLYTEFATRCHFLLAMHYKGFENLEDSIQARISQMAGGIWKLF